MSFAYKPKGNVQPMMGKPPAGRYVVQLVSTENERSRENTCDRISFEFRVLEGGYAGKAIYIRLNANHTTSAKSNEIFEERMDALLFAVGRPQGFNDIKEIYNIPFVLDVYTRKNPNTDKENYEIGGMQKHVTKPSAPLPPRQETAAAVSPNSAAAQVRAPRGWQPPQVKQDEIAF
tara:strand:- start:20 stop:547 length:528 start_codon:yes stop_codon:yes gene_type:complete